MTLSHKFASLLESEKIERFLNKYKGGYFGIACGLIQSFMLLGGAIIFNLTENLAVPLTIYTHWISNLGAARNGAQYVFITGMLLNIALSIPFFLDIARKCFQEKPKMSKLLLISLISLIIADISSVFLTIYNLIDFPVLHVIFATIFFNSSELLVASLSVTVASKRKSNKWLIQSALGVPVIACFSLFLIPIIPMLFEGNDLFSIITSMNASLNSIRFWEWMSIISLTFWFFGSGLFLVLYMQSPN
ncbi:MAG: hypothetical protein ACFFAS_06210 [Promethearchaeota archaeon]